MPNQDIVLQAVGNDGVVQRWVRRSYVRHLPLRRNFFEQDPDEGPSNDQQQVAPMLDPKTTKLEELGCHILARVFQSLSILDRLRMEHVSRLFRNTAKMGWIGQRKIVVIPEDAGRAYFRLIMKRCCRYTFELVIYQLVPRDRLFKLLQLCFLLRHLCLDYLSPLSGSEFLEISERMPELRSLVVKNCRLHYKFARDFQRMLDGLQHLQVLSVVNCEGFDKLEIERLPSTLQIIQLNYLDGSLDRQMRIIRTIRQHVPNVKVLVLDEGNEQAHVLMQPFQNIKVLVLPFHSWDWRGNRAENIEFYPREFLLRLTALDFGEVTVEFGTLRFSALQLPNLEYLVLQLTRIVNANQFFNAVVGLPALRSLTLKMKGNTFSEPPHWRGKDRQLYDSLMSMAQRGIIEYLDVSWPLNTSLAVEFVKNCSVCLLKLRALFFGIRNAKHRDSEEEFVWKSFIKSLDELKKGLLPKEDFQKIRMFRNVFGEYTGTNPWNSDFKLVPVKHPWIVCLGKAIPSHVLGEVCLKELGENVDVTTELFKFPPRVQVPEKIIED
uniref:F-box domain-containing protein n=1 Tax=Meloidogyne javanica TaxID=6303 RepID=A0A915M6V2_MELJA